MNEDRASGGIAGWLRHAPLRVVVTVPIVALIVATAAVIAWVSLSDITPAVQDVALRLRSEVLTRVTERLRDYLQTPHLVNEQNRLALRSGLLDLDDPQNRQRFFRNQVAAHPLILYSFFGTPEGEFYGARRLPGDELQIVRAGRQTGGDSHNFATGPLGDAGELRQVYPRYDPRTRPWYTAGTAARGPAWSPLYRHFTIKDMALTAALPVYDETGGLLGVFGVDYVLSGLHDFLAGLNVSSGGQVFILERDGNLVAASAAPEGGFFRERDGKPERIAALDCGTPAIQAAAARLASLPGGLAGLSGELLAEFDLEGRQQYLQVVPFSDGRGLDWLVAAVVPASDVLGRMQSKIRDAVGLCVLAVALAVFAGVVLSARIVRPIEELGQAAEAYSRGRWDHPVRLRRGDEIGQLAEAFRGMAGQLRESFATLEQKVAERTAALSEANARLTREVAERERAQQAQRASASRLRAIFEAIPGHVHVIDTEFRILDAGDKLLAALGLTREQVVGRKCHEALKGLASICPYCDVDAASPSPVVCTRQSRPEEEKLLGMAFKVYSAPVRGDDGQVWGFIECLMDISDLRAMEEQLLAAKTEAETASRAKSRFLAAMSHEIRTPMNAVIGLTESVLQSSLTGEQRDQLETVKDAADHLLLVINDILDLSRIEAVGLTLESRHFLLGDLLDSVLRTMRVQAGRKGLVIDLEQAPGLPPALVGDPGRLRQVLINLLGNAVKFTHEGGVVLRVDRAPASPGDGEAVRLSFDVTDTGQGIPPDRLNEIFEPFRLGGDAPLRNHGGTGLGLTISREIVEKMGGTIRAESQPGRGSVFSFTARFAPGDTARAEAEATPDIPGTARPLRLLLGEDNPVNVKVAQTLLTRLGHSVTALGDGRAILARLADERFDAVLLDLEMPGLDGLETARRIRAGEAGEAARQTPLLAMTAHVVGEYRELCRAAGMDGFVPKPATLAVLAAALAPVAAPPGAPPPTPPAAAESSGEQAALLDLDGFLANVDGDREFAGEVFGLFLQGAPGKIAAVAQTLERGDMAALARLSHSLKGECGAVGAARCRDLAARMEQAARREDAQEAGKLLPGLRTALERTLAEMRTFLDGG